MSCSSRSRFLSWLPIAAGVLSAVVGLVVLIEWALGFEALRTGPAAIEANTALCLVLVGGGLVLRSRRVSHGEHAGTAVAVAAAGIGLLSLLEYAIRVNLGIDEVLFRDPSVPGIPGRMAIPTAASIVLVALALALADVETRRGRRPSQVAALIAALLPLLALLGHLYGARRLISYV